MRIAHKKNAPLEQKQRLSRSMLWKLQREFYEQTGVQAWNKEFVPRHVTSNPFIADAYAKVVCGFLRDCQAAGWQSARPSFAPLDDSQPLYIVELGAGHGGFSYLFLKKFLKLYRNSLFKEIPVRYVMTDLAERNVESWPAHPRLQPFFEEGFLDVARFDAERDDELTLRRSGATLSAGAVRNPVVLIANYVFDSIPQDAFAVEQGQLYESLITLSSNREAGEPVTFESLSDSEISYTSHPVGQTFYDDPDFDRILHDCQRRLPETAFLFPIASLRCVRNFQRLSGGRLLLLSGDKGYSRDEALLEGQGAPVIAVHAKGCFSMMVDYQIIGEYFLSQGGLALNPTHSHESISVSAFLLGDPPGGYAETRLAYAAEVEEFGPDDMFTLLSGVEQYLDALSLEQLVALLRLSGWDYRIFWNCLPALQAHAPSLSEEQKNTLSEAVRNVWDAYFPIGEEQDLAFRAGTLLYEIGFYSEALDFFRRSADLHGVAPGTAYNTALCYYGLRQMETSLEHIELALELDPESDAAKAMRIKLRSAMRR